jgi:glutathione S-transferase
MIIQDYQQETHMKLYNSVGPNPKVVRMFLAEKGLSLPLETIDLLGGENRREPYVAGVNPAGQTPALEVEAGVTIAEITVICEYLEELHPTPSVIGETPMQRAETRMWTRRIDLNICEPLTNAFRAAEGRALFQSRVKLVGEQGAAELKVIAKDRLHWLSSQMGDRKFICGDRFSLADIMLFVFLEFGASVGQNLTQDTPWITAWYERVKARASAAA